MQTTQILTLIILCATMFGVVGLIIALSNHYTLGNIKNRRVGDGQYGTAKFASHAEIKRTYRIIPYTPKKWRVGDFSADVNRFKLLCFKLWSKILKKKIIPKVKTITLPQGTIVGMKKTLFKTYALVDTGDVHTLMIGAAGVGKTACFLFPNLEYACASGMSFITTDTKGDLARSYGKIAQDYGYDVAVIDLRNPTCSNGFNMLHLVNKYMDEYLKTKSLAAKAKAEKYAKITAKTIIFSEGGDATTYGQNAFFYDAAEGLLTATILLTAEYCDKDKRHVVSLFKLIQDLLEPSQVKGKTQFQLLINRLPDTHKARWFAGAALNSSEQAMASVLSTILSRLNSFLDSELEQILCFDTCIDAEKFCNRKSAIFLIMPEEDATKYFLISLIIQQLYREILSVADENGGKLDNRVMMYLDEIGTIPPIQSAEMMFSASRSRKVSIVAIIQSLAQLEKNYEKEGASIIVDNCQVTLFGGFAPNSETAKAMSENLGSQTVMSGSVTRSSRDGSQQLDMISRALMTPDELKTMPKFHFIVAKTGCNPMRTKLELFFKWGIELGKPYIVGRNDDREVKYAGKEDIYAKLKSEEESEPVSAPLQSEIDSEMKDKAKEKAKEAQNHVKKNS